ncbi:MAG: hypothetical protein U0414_25005 [Polyangiaceae bacterium]
MGDRDPGGYIEDDESGTMAANPNAPSSDAGALPFRFSQTPAPYPQQTVNLPVTPFGPTPSGTPWGAAIAPQAAPVHVPPPPAPPAPPPSNAPVAPPAVQSPGGWGSGQASFVSMPRPLPAPPAPVRRSEEELQRAAALGAGAASNAAIGIETLPKPIAPPAKAKPLPVEDARAVTRVELLAVDRLEMDRIRSSKHLSEKPADDELVDEWKSADPPLQTSVEAKERGEAHRVLARATPMAPEELEPTLGSALDASTGVCPVVLVSGELTLALDPHDALRALRGYASAWSTPQDKRLGEALELVDAVLAAPIVLADAVQIARVRLDEALRAANRPALREVEPVIDRTLLESRSFARRNVFGDRRVLAYLEGTPPLPVYLSEALARELPLMKRFPARIVAEIRPQQDASEAHAVALRAIALGRIVAAPRRR